MSADIPTVILTGPAMVPLVRAAAALAAEDLPPFAVIGGVAVTIRLGRVLRATADLDAVTDQRYTPTALGASPLRAPALERRAIPGDHRRGDCIRRRDIPRLLAAGEHLMAFRCLTGCPRR